MFLRYTSLPSLKGTPYDIVCNGSQSDLCFETIVSACRDANSLHPLDHLGFKTTLVPQDTVFPIEFFQTSV